MLKKNPKYRKNISSSQVRLLELLFKFRFVSVPLLSDWENKDKSTIYERLLVLVEQGYIRKQYNSSYRLPQRPAVYSLAPKGINQLREINHARRYSEAALRNMYKNRSASVALIDHCLDVSKLCLQLNKQYPDTFYTLGRSEMSNFNKLIRPLPDIYLKRQDKRSTKPDYLVETIEAWTMTWILKKRIQAHERWLDDHEELYPDLYPTILYICENASTERRIHGIIENSYLDFGVWTITRERLSGKKKDVWCTEWYVSDEGEMVLKGL